MNLFKQNAAVDQRPIPSEESPAASLPGVVGPERPRPPATFSNPAGVSEKATDAPQVASHTGTSTAAQRSKPGTLPCLSILQPWPHMIFHHHKLIENRMWVTSVKGTILIHTGKSTRLIAPAYSQMITEELRGRGYAQCPQVGSFDIQRQLVYGALVGVASLVCCTRARALAVQRAHEFNPDCPISQDVYADPEAEAFFVFAQVTKFSAPIPWKGERGIFQIPTSVVQHELDALNWKVKACS